MSSDLKIVVLPVLGVPVAKVWLPQDRQVQGLEAPWRAGDGNVSRSVRRKVNEWGLPDVLNAPFRVYKRLKLNVWVCLVPPGRAPSGLTELPFHVVIQHPLFGRIVSDYNEYWRDRLG